MPQDAKALVNATQQIEKHLANYAKRRETVEKGMADLVRRLEAVDKAFGVTENKVSAALEALAQQRVEMDSHLRFLTLTLSGVREPSPQYEQVQRRYLEAKKTVRQVADETLEKWEAHNKNKMDKKAEMAWQLHEKAI